MGKSISYNTQSLGMCRNELFIWKHIHISPNLTMQAHQSTEVWGKHPVVGKANSTTSCQSGAQIITNITGCSILLLQTTKFCALKHSIWNLNKCNKQPLGFAFPHFAYPSVTNYPTPLLTKLASLVFTKIWELCCPASALQLFPHGAMCVLLSELQEQGQFLSTL